MLPPELANPFRRPPAVPLNPDTAGMVGDMLGPEAKKAFEALDKEPKKPKEKPQELTEQEKAAMRKAEKDLMERSKEKKEFPTWKTIPLGEYETVEEFTAALKKGRFNIDAWALGILNHIPLSSSSTSVELVSVSLKDLGFEQQATTQEIYDRAEELCFSLCPPEVVPALRLHYPDQPMNEWIRVAIEPIAGLGGEIGVFSIGCNNNGCWIKADSGRPDDVWDAGIRWVFLRSKKM